MTIEMGKIQPYYEQSGITIYHGDCRDVLLTLVPVDSVVTDPPYGLTADKANWREKSGEAFAARPDLATQRGNTARKRGGFMGQEWDAIVPGVEFWRLILAACKPGAMCLAFGGTRTFHRLTCAIEDAGFEIRDCVQWLYGSGFPKSLDISKAIDEHYFGEWLRANPCEAAKYTEQMRQAKGNSDAIDHVRRKFRKAAGAERDVVGRYRSPEGTTGNAGSSMPHPMGWGKAHDALQPITAPATEAAKLWNGWGTALKPAWEPIVVAMKPLDGTFAENAIKHGVAGLNIDGCRIATSADDAQAMERCNTPGSGRFADGPIGKIYGGGKGVTPPGRPLDTSQGRWPANLILDGSDEVLAGFPETGPAGKGTGLTDTPARSWKNASIAGINRIGHGDSGSAARYFYTAKASSQDRGNRPEESFPLLHQTTDAFVNTHPTVKPLALMEYLCKLTMTPTGGIVLDPFMGSGTTLLAARMVGRSAIGIDNDEESCEIAAVRLRNMVREMG